MRNRQYIAVAPGKKLLAKPRYLVVDLETTGLNPQTDFIVGVAFAYNGHQGLYSKELDSVRHLLEDESVVKIFHNAVFDMSMLKAAGVEVRGQIHDTMILAHLIDPDRKEIGLKDLAKSLLSPDATVKDQVMKEWLGANGLKRADMHKAPEQILQEYACEDAINTYALFERFIKQMREMNEWLKKKGFKRNPWNYYIEEMIPMIPVIRDMQLDGVRIDLEATAKRKHTLLVRQAELLAELSKVEYIKQVEDILYEEKVAKRKAKNKTGKLKKMPERTSFNWFSNNHLAILFFDILGEKSLRTTLKGNASLDGKVLEGFESKYPFVSLLLEYKEITKLLDTYLDNLLTIQQGGIIHANYNITGTATGRLSSSNPNLQNVPKHGEIKQLFIPRDGHNFVYADYSQLELRVAAHLSRDELMVEEYRKELKGEKPDLHQITADTIGIARDLAKTVNFAIIYNASAWRVKDILGLQTVEEADEIMRLLFGRYKGLKRYIDTQKRQMERLRIAYSEFGRIRRLAGLGSVERKVVNHAFKAGFNMPIQSFGASLCKRSMIELHKRGYRIVNQVHDSIIVEVTETSNSMDEIKGVMENIAKLAVPLLAEPKILTSFAEK